MSKTGCIYCMYEELGEYEEPCRYCEDASEFRDKAGWIPCNERMPVEPEYDCDGYIVQADNIAEPFSAYWYGDGWEDTDGMELDNIIAWQPLPEPYKESEEQHGTL